MNPIGEIRLVKLKNLYRIRILWEGKEVFGYGASPTKAYNEACELLIVKPFLVPKEEGK